MDTRALIATIIIDTLVVVGGVIGSSFYVKRIEGPRERAFVIKMFVAMWLLIISLFVGMALILSWMKFLLFIPYTILLVPLVLYWNRKQRQIHLEEAGQCEGNENG